jgi:2,3-bisphosphoglycerate-dependent phosphoglycerate mutase
MKQKILVLLHCESCYNRDGIFTGRVDSILTKKGHEHAAQLAKELQDENISTAFRSSLTRAKQTVDHLLEYHPNTKVITDDRIIERDYGELASLKKAKYKKDHPVLFPIYHRSYDVTPPNGESILQVEKRVHSFIYDLLFGMKKNKGNVLIVGHGNSMRPFRRFFENLSIEQMMQLENQRDKIFTYDINVNEKINEFQLFSKLCGYSDSEKGKYAYS